MYRRIQNLLKGQTAFSLIQQQDSDEVLLLSGTTAQSTEIMDIPRKQGKPTRGQAYDSLSVVPFCQIREKGYPAIDGGEAIRSLLINSQHQVPIEHLITVLPDMAISMDQAISYNTTREAYARLIHTIVEDEIGNGEGANFVIPRTGKGRIKDFSVSQALSIFRSLLINDYGTYWKFLFYDLQGFFIGATPESHLHVTNGLVNMNPISGTLRKEQNHSDPQHLKSDLMRFLTNRKEINELSMVVDEELKMMARMCTKGSSIKGPLLKEMSRLIHTEYLLTGQSDTDIFELFIQSMFAATVVGSPLKNACRINKKYLQASRRYYGSALMLVGRDKHGGDFLDAPITIRTVEIESSGMFHFGVGATLVKDSDPMEEVRETEAKSSAIIASLTGERQQWTTAPMLPMLQDEAEIKTTLTGRNKHLSDFWFFKQESSSFLRQRERQAHCTLIDNDDDFIHMLAHVLHSLGLQTTIIHHNNYAFDSDHSDITLLGPGPGNPNQVQAAKISTNMRIAEQLLQAGKPSLYICLGHQILCKSLGYTIKRKQKPLQGSQQQVNLFGREEVVGFYNTFAPLTDPGTTTFQTAVLPQSEELIAIRGPHYTGFQFHPESVLTQNGRSILQEAIDRLLP